MRTLRRVLVSWVDSELYYFRGNDDQGWQLMFRTEHEEAEMGLRLKQRPSRVAILTGE